MNIEEYERYQAAKAKDLKRRRDKTAENPKRRKTAMAERHEEFEATGAIVDLQVLWAKFKAKDCKNTCHLIAGYEDEAMMAAQDELLTGMEVCVGPGCMCLNPSDKDKKLHKHRHILVLLTDRMTTLKKNNNIARAFPKEKFPSNRWIQITCELHLKNVIHYVHCKESMENKDLESGTWQKGSHVHHSFFNCIDGLLHEKQKCRSMRRFLDQTLHPTHNFRHCSCLSGMCKVEIRSWITTRPHPVRGDPNFLAEMQMTRYYKRLMKQYCSLKPDRDRPYNIKVNHMSSAQKKEVEDYFKATVDRYEKKERPVARVDPLPSKTAALPPKIAGMPLRY